MKSPGSVGWTEKISTKKLKIWTGQNKYGKMMNPIVYMIKAEYYFPDIENPQKIFEGIQTKRHEWDKNCEIIPVERFKNSNT